MSLKTIWEHIKEAIGSIFHNVSAEIKGVILPAAIKITDIVKTMVDVDSEDIIGLIISKAGAEWEDKLRTALPKVLTAMIIYNAANKEQDYLAILKSVVDDLKLSSNEQWDTFWHSFSSNLLNCLADEKLTLKECFYLAQFYKDNHPA